MESLISAITITHTPALPYKVKTQYVRVSNITDTSIKHTYNFRSVQRPIVKKIEWTYV